MPLENNYIEPFRIYMSNGYSNTSKILPGKIFFEFARLSLSGFGGVLPFLRHSLVERNHWLNDEEFAHLLSVGQVLPGANIVNLSVMLGWRFAGWRGSLAAFVGLLIVPSILLLLIGVLYEQVSIYPVMKHVMIGIASVAAGLVLATGFKLALVQPKTLRGALFAITAFILVALLHWRLPSVLMVLVPGALIVEGIYFKRTKGKD